MYKIRSTVAYGQQYVSPRGAQTLCSASNFSSWCQHQEYELNLTLVTLSRRLTIRQIQTAATFCNWRKYGKPQHFLQKCCWQSKLNNYLTICENFQQAFVTCGYGMQAHLFKHHQTFTAGCDSKLMPGK